MTDIQTGFSKSYAEARQKFLNAAHTAGLTVDSNIHPLKGRDGEELAMDVVLDGAADAQQLLVISSACHGVEGYCGSGVQVHALQNTAFVKRPVRGVSRCCTSMRSTHTGSRMCAG